jgi:hypothetical protein
MVSFLHGRLPRVSNFQRVFVRLSDPEHQVGLLIFLWNSGVKAIERIGADSLKIEDEHMSESQVRHVLDVWLSRHPLVRLEISP